MRQERDENKDETMDIRLGRDDASEEVNFKYFADIWKHNDMSIRLKKEICILPCF